MSETTVAITTYPALVGAVLATKRKAAGYSQTALAERLDLTVSTWSRIENGESAINVEQLAQAAEFLETQPSAILHAADEKVAELRKKGIGTSSVRKDAEAIAAAGSIPIVGATLLSMMGPVGMLAAGAISGYKLISKLRDKGENK